MKNFQVRLSDSFLKDDVNYYCRLPYELTHSGSCIDPTAVMISLTLPLPFKLLDGIQLVWNAVM